MADLLSTSKDFQVKRHGVSHMYILLSFTICSDICTRNNTSYQTFNTDKLSDVSKLMVKKYILRNYMEISIQDNKIRKGIAVSNTQE